MRKILRGCAVIIIAAAVALFAAWPRPTQDEVLLRAIGAEAKVLLAAPLPADGSIPKARWPRAIASLNPEFVTVGRDGVDIMAKPYFDGGWGYLMPRTVNEQPQPEGRFTKLDQGIYWYHPY